MGADKEPGGRPMDPSEALTAAEAARRAGVRVAEIRRAMDAGRLLFEIGRRRGKDVRLVRFMDLALLYPRLRSEVTQTEPGPDPGPTTGPTSGPRAGPAQPAPRSDEPPPAEPVPEEKGLGHAFEVRLAAMQASNAGLSEQLLDLRDVREDLRAQCSDLRIRLSTLEKERQATTAGLLMAQRRILELEAGPASSPAWRRTAVWGMAIVSIAATLMWRDAARSGSELEREIGELGLEVSTGDEALAGALSEIAETRVQFAAQLERIEERSRTTLAELDSERTAAQEQRRILESRIDAERTRASDLGERLQAELEQAALRWNEVQDTLRGAREETQRTARESEAALEAALSAVEAERAASRSEREKAAELLREQERALLAERQAAQQRMEDLLTELRAARDATAVLLASLPGGADERASDETAPVAPRSLAERAYDVFRAWVSEGAGGGDT